MTPCKTVLVDQYTLGCSVHNQSFQECQRSRIVFLELQVKEMTEFAGRATQKIHDLQHSGSSPLCPQWPCREFFGRTTVIEKRVEVCAHKWRHDKIKDVEFCSVCDTEKKVTELPKYKFTQETFKKLTEETPPGKKEGV